MSDKQTETAVNLEVTPSVKHSGCISEEFKSTKYQCPLCNGEIIWVRGTRMNATDGVTLYCPNMGCPAQEVMGHGGNEKEAWTVIQQKFVKREDRE